MKDEKLVQVSLSVPKVLLEKIREVEEGSTASDYILKTLESSAYQISESERKKNGVVYTPNTLAKYVSEKVVYYARKGRNKQSQIEREESLYILDPACGDGELLFNIQSCLENSNLNSSTKITPVFHGLDIDGNALARAGRRIDSKYVSNFVRTNALCPYKKRLESGWKALKSKWSAEEGFDIIIANPPWGADIGDYEELLVSGDLALHTGQFDTSDLFVESSLKILKRGGFGAFIIPDSLFAQERYTLREMIANQTTIKFIGRFGEKIFKDVNRACAVVIFQNKLPSKRGKVDCFRLCPNNKNLVLTGQNSFAEIEKRVAHSVEQSRFRENKNYLFNIDLPNEHAPLYSKIVSAESSVSQYLSSARGIELSKKGAVLQCNSCSKWLPFPSRTSFKCPHCKTPNSREGCLQENIIQNTKSKGLTSLIVGQDITRFSVEPKLYIDTSKSGINYKEPATYKGEKLVVRKTGVGVSASIDYSESLTNQVVYIFKINSDSEDELPLEFFLILFCSRLIFFYITMSTGENEWKSHPYLTQRQILDIPIPNLDFVGPTLKQRIKSTSKKLRNALLENRPIPKKMDIECERLVMDLYELNTADYESVFHVINSSQDLLPVKALKTIEIEALS